MAILTCPHCGYRQASAAKCMNCGTLFATQRQAATPKTPQAEPVGAERRSAIPAQPTDAGPRPGIGPIAAVPADTRAVSAPASVATQDADPTAASVPAEPASAPTAIPEAPVPAAAASGDAPAVHDLSAAQESLNNGAASAAESDAGESPLPASLSAELSDALTAVLPNTAARSAEISPSAPDPAPLATSAAVPSSPSAEQPAPAAEFVPAGSPDAATPVSSAPTAESKPPAPVAARSSVVPSLLGGASPAASAKGGVKLEARPTAKPGIKPIDKPAAPHATESQRPQAARKPARSGFAKFWSVARWFMLASLITTVALILHRSSPPAVADTPQATAQADALFAQAQAQVRAGQPAQVRLTQAELTSFLDANLAISGSGDGATAQQDPSSVRDVKITMDGNTLQAYLLFGFHGEELSLVLDGQLGVSDGSLQFTPLGGKVGSLPLPQVALEAAISRMMNSPENREKLRVPDSVRDIHVENGELVIDYR